MLYHKDIISQNIKDIKQKVAESAIKSGRTPDSVKIIAATKTVPSDIIRFACKEGISHIGENRVQEFLKKYEDLKDEPLTFHFIGALQTNKVKYIIDKVDMIHSVDSERLAKEISRQAQKHNLVMKILVEINIANEESKAGINPLDTISFIEKISKLEGISVRGLMAIPPISNNNAFNGKNDENIHKNEENDKTFEYFQKIKQILIDISAKKLDNIVIEELSLGMSGDFEEAIRAGSTMIRPGRILFGERN